MVTEDVLLLAGIDDSTGREAAITVPSCVQH